MKRTEVAPLHLMGDGGGRLYIKKDWLIMLDIDPKKKDDVEVLIEVDSQGRELRLRKK